MAVHANDNFVRHWLSHYNDHQTDPAWIDKAIADLTPNSQHVNHGNGKRQSGSDGLRELVTFFSEGFPGSQIRITNSSATDNQAALEFIGEGDNTGPLHMPGGDIPPTGRHAQLQFRQEFQISRGKITSFETFYDMTNLMQQLGLPTP
jgi:predicted ester cyclase